MLPRPVQQRAGAVAVEPEPIGRLGVAEPIEPAEAKHLGLARRQLGQRRPEPLGQLTGLGLPARIGIAIQLVLIPTIIRVLEAGRRGRRAV